MIEVSFVGKTRTEVNAQMRDYLGLDAEPVPTAPERADFLTEAAAENPSVPSALHAAIPLIPSVPVQSVAPVAHVDTSGLDNRGLPWDSRIHASSRAKTAKGEWRYRRGIEDHHVNTVEQELIAKIKGAQPQEMLPPPSVPASAPVLPFPSIIPQAVVHSPPAPPPVVVPSMPNAHTVQTFKQHIVPIFAKLAKEGRINQPYVQSLKDHFGVQEIHLVNDEQASGLFNMFADCGFVQRA